MFLRNKLPTIDEIDTFNQDLEDFIDAVHRAIPEKKIEASRYYHILRDDVPRYVKFWFQNFGIGIGVFWSSCPEHANKMCKEIEADRTNLSDDRMIMVMELVLARIFFFTDDLKSDLKRAYQCGRCDGKGHQSNNKSCPRYEWENPFNVEEYFSNHVLETKDRELFGDKNMYKHVLKYADYMGD